MLEKVLKISLMAGLVTAAVCFLFSMRTAVGVILGLVFYRIYMWLLSSQMDDTLSYQRSFFSASQILRYMMLAFPMLLGFVFPQHVGIAGVVIGLLMFKICLYAYSSLNKG